MIELTISWWMIPTLITVVGVGWAVFIYDDGGGMFSGIGNLLMLVPVLVVSCIAWIIVAVLK